MRTNRALTIAVLLGTVAGATCHQKEDERAQVRPAADLPPPKQPVRVAAEDEDLRVMLAELAAAKACTMIRGQFRPLRAVDRPDVVTGTLWIRGCKITQRGKRVTFHLTGQGWQWADEQKEKAGAEFQVRQYVRFEVETTITGSLDIAYDRKQHVVSLWFSPLKLPEVSFRTLGDIAVDEKGAWSSVVGALGTVIGESPEEQASDQAKTDGRRELRKQFADGLSVTVDLCTGLPRFGMGRPAQGKMVAPDAGETPKVSIELQPGGLMVFGPYQAPRGLTAKAHVRSGAVRLEVACQDEADKLTAAYLAGGGTLAPLRRLGRKDLRGDGTLKVKGARCPVVVVARPLGTFAEPVTFDWQRPTREAARAAGGPLIQCD